MCQQASVGVARDTPVALRASLPANRRRTAEGRARSVADEDARVPVRERSLTADRGIDARDAVDGDTGRRRIRPA